MKGICIAFLLLCGLLAGSPGLAQKAAPTSGKATLRPEQWTLVHEICRCAQQSNVRSAQANADGPSLPKCISGSWDKHRDMFKRAFPGVAREWDENSARSPELDNMTRTVIQNCPYLKRIDDSARAVTVADERKRIANEMCGCMRKSGGSEYGTRKFKTALSQCVGKAYAGNEAGFKKAYPKFMSGDPTAFEKLFASLMENCGYIRDLAAKQRQAAMPDTNPVADTVKAKQDIADDVCGCAARRKVSNLADQKDLAALGECIDLAWNRYPGKARSAFPQAYREFKSGQGNARREQMFYDLINACPALNTAMDKRANAALPDSGLGDGDREDRRALSDEICACIEKGKITDLSDDEMEKTTSDCMNAARLADVKRFMRAYPTYNGGKAYNSRIWVNMISECPVLMTLVENRFREGVEQNKSALNRDSLQYVLRRDTASLNERKLISKKVCTCYEGKAGSGMQYGAQLTTCLFQIFYSDQKMFTKAYGSLFDGNSTAAGQKIGFDIALWYPETARKIQEQRDREASEKERK